MTLDKFDAEMQDKFRSDAQELPEMVRDRVDRTLLDLPEKRKSMRARVKTYASVAVALIALVVAFGAFSPQVAMALNQQQLAEALEDLALVKSVKSVFNLKTTMTRSEFVVLGISNLKDAHDVGAFSEVGEVAEDHGLKLEITELLFDGTSFSLGYILTSEDGFQSVEPGRGLNDLEWPEMSWDAEHYREELRKLKGYLQSITLDSIYINGEKQVSFGYYANGDFIDANQFAGIIHLQPGVEGFTDEDAFQLELNISNIGYLRGSWPFTIDVVRNDGFSHVYVIDQEATYEDTIITIDTIIFSPSAVEVVWSARSKRSITSIEVIDDQGWEIRKSMSFSSRYDGVNYSRSQFKSVDEIPDYVIVRPVSSHDNSPLADLTEALEMRIELR